jgi:hypothetical protein
MDILLGVSTLAATTLLLSFAYGAHRRPVPSSWTRTPGLSMLTCVALTLMGPVGLGFLVKAALNPMLELQTLSISVLVVAGALVAIAFVASPVLIRPALKAKRPAAPTAHNDNAAPSVVEAAVAA